MFVKLRASMARCGYAFRCGRDLASIGIIGLSWVTMGGTRIVTDNDTLGVLGYYPHEPCAVVINTDDGQPTVVMNESMRALPLWVQDFVIAHEQGHLAQPRNFLLSLVLGWIGFQPGEYQADDHAMRVLGWDRRRAQQALFLVCVGANYGIDRALAIKDALPEDLLAFAREHRFPKLWRWRLERLHTSS